MKTNLLTPFLLILGLFAVTAIRPNFQKALTALQKVEQVTPSLRSVMQALVEITEDEEINQVIDIIQTVRDELASLLQGVNDQITLENGAFEDSRTTYENTLYDLGTSIDNANSELEQTHGEATSLEGALSSERDALTSAQNSREAELQRREEFRVATAQALIDLDAAIAACDEAAQILSGVREQDAQVTSLTLLETHRQLLHTKLVHIQSKLRKVKTKYPIAPFIDTLVEVAQDSVNAEAIDRILYMIQDLKNSLIQERNAAEAAEENDVKTSQNVIANLDSTISTLQDSIARNQDALYAANEKIGNLDSQVADLKTLLGQAHESLDGLISSHDAKIAQLNSTVDRLQRDIDACDAALAYLRGLSVRPEEPEEDIPDTIEYTEGETGEQYRDRPRK